MVVSPNQNVILKNINPADKKSIEDILIKNGVHYDRKDFTDTRLTAMACPAFPLCGLATAEAERVMPQTVTRLENLLSKLKLKNAITMRMTGCPNGCARPYMAELGLVGNGPNQYQLWLGASANQTRLSWVLIEKLKIDDFERTLEPILLSYKSSKRRIESFGDFCNRMGKEKLLEIVEAFDPSANNGVAAKATAKPRVSVTKNTMERLTRVSEMRGISASKMANEILEKYIDTMESEVGSAPM